MLLLKVIFLAEIETDKATMEFESFNEGTLLYIGIQEGNTAPVDSLLAIIGPAGTDISGIADNYTAGGAATASAPATEEQKLLLLLKKQQKLLLKLQTEEEF